MKPIHVVGWFIVVGFVALSSSAWSQARPADEDLPANLTSNQALMRDKLVQMNKVLEGLTQDQFADVEAASRTLLMISKATTWHVVDPSPQYTRLSKNFQEQAADLERHAKERNTEAATLDLIRMTMTCTHCHQHMRDRE